MFLLTFALLRLPAPAALQAADDPDPVKQDEETLKAAKIATDGPGLLEFFRRRTLTNADLKRIKELIHDLGDDSFETRQNASAQLVNIGAPAVPLLKQALKDTDIEVVRRAEDCLKRIETGTSTVLVATAARLLAVRKPEGTSDVLLAFLPVADEEMVAEAVRATLAAVAVRDGKPDPALVAALEDQSPIRRAAAGEALCRAGAAELKTRIRKLLDDKSPLVRLRVGLALAEAKEKAAIPVLIDLLEILPPGDTGLIEDALYLLAGEKAPAITAGADADSRRAYKTAWLAWWIEFGPTAELGKLTQPAKILGHTMMVFLDEGKLLELDSAKRERWKIDGLAFPLDAQYLPGDKVLIAEQGGNRVTERDVKTGKIVWEKQVAEPLMAQRLPNGTTLIAARHQIIEVDRGGRTLHTHSRPNGEFIMRAQKLRNGDLAMVAMDANTTRFVRIDAAGKELVSFPVQVRTSGGRIDVLPNGHVLIPEMNNNRVAEYDTTGKVVWSATVPQPIAAVHLPNGHILATSMTTNRAVELDRTGKQVWEYAYTSRISRAWRR
jgi:hypothetical protein